MAKRSEAERALAARIRAEDAREHAAARAAQVAFKAARRHRNRVVTIKRPSRSELAREAAAAAQAAALDRAADAAFAERNPAAAQAQAAIAEGNAALERAYGHKVGGTPPTYAAAERRARGGALARLAATGGIDVHELAAAVEIAEVVERLGRDVQVKTASLETRIDQSRHGDGFWESLTRVRIEVTYTRWRAALGADIWPVLEMLTGETTGYTVIARRYRLSARRARQLLIDALARWIDLRHRVGREVDARDVELAQIRAGV